MGVFVIFDYTLFNIRILGEHIFQDQKQGMHMTRCFWWGDAYFKSELYRLRHRQEIREHAKYLKENYGRQWKKHMRRCFGREWKNKI